MREHALWRLMHAGIRKNVREVSLCFFKQAEKYGQNCAKVRPLPHLCPSPNNVQHCSKVTWHSRHQTRTYRVSSLVSRVRNVFRLFTTRTKRSPSGLSHQFVYFVGAWFHFAIHKKQCPCVKRDWADTFASFAMCKFHKWPLWKLSSHSSLVVD